MRALLTSPLVELFHQLLRGHRSAPFGDDVEPKVTGLFVLPEGSGHYIADEHTAQAAVLVGYVNEVVVALDYRECEGDDGLFTVFEVSVPCLPMHPCTESGHGDHITLFQAADDHGLRAPQNVFLIQTTRGTNQPTDAGIR